MNTTNRTEFEAWFRAGLGDPAWLKRSGEKYADMETEHMWQAWQAARAQPEHVSLSDAQIFEIANRHDRIKSFIEIGQVQRCIFMDCVDEILAAQAEAQDVPFIVCGGNDANAPCAYPSGGQSGCVRDARIAAQADHYEDVLDMVVQPVISEATPICRNCMNTRIEKGIYKNTECQFCKETTITQYPTAESTWVDEAIRNSDAQDAMCDKQYACGFRAGWSASESGNESLLSSMSNRESDANRVIKAISAVNQDDVAGDAVGDEVIELAQALEQSRAVQITKYVSELPAGGATNNMPTAFEAGYQMACEEITHRLRTEKWDFCLTPVDADISEQSDVSDINVGDIPENGTGIGPAPNPDAFKSGIQAKLRALSAHMERIAVEMDYHGGFAPRAKHGGELMGAAGVVGHWAIECNASKESQ